MSPTRILGGLLVLVGLVFMIEPTLVHDPGPAIDTFAAIERSILWGGLMGVVGLLIARTQLKPWAITFASLVFWLTTGFLLARGVGLVLDGADSQKQWMWVGVEVVVIIGAAAYLWRKQGAASSDRR